MGHWVTLDDDQHVYISDGGKVLATRGKISSAGRGKERGKALRTRSKIAVEAAINRTSLGTIKNDVLAKSKREQEQKDADIAFQARMSKIDRVGRRVQLALNQAKATREAKGNKRISPREKVLNARLVRVVRQIGK